MKKDGCALYVSNHYWWRIFVGSQVEWKNFIKGEYGAIETKGGSLLQFVDKEGHRVALADFAVNLHEKESS
jgi:cytochrome c oxidase subunit 3